MVSASGVARRRACCRKEIKQTQFISGLGVRVSRLCSDNPASQLLILGPGDISQPGMGKEALSTRATGQLQIAEKSCHRPQPPSFSNEIEPGFTDDMEVHRS